MNKETIKKIRLSQGLDQLEFASEIGVSRTTVCNWETGKKPPRPSAIKKMLEFCQNHNIPLEW